MYFEYDNYALAFISFWRKPGSLNTALQICHVGTEVDIGLSARAVARTIVGIGVTLQAFAATTAGGTWNARSNCKGWTAATTAATTATMRTARRSWSCRRTSAATVCWSASASHRCWCWRATTAFSG
jgi:hypothetical protein